jgi:hypothetical protein
MANWTYYDEFPSRETLEADFDGFMATTTLDIKGKMLKVGKSYLERIIGAPGKEIAPRYQHKGKYEFLTEPHVFAICGSEKMALEVERAQQDILKERGLLINRSDAGEGMYSGNEEYTYIVYVTVLNQGLYQCPLLSCRVVMQRSGIEEHKLAHSHMRKVVETNMLLEKLQLRPLDITIEPKKVSFKII